jgi:hypothetical protein
MLLDSGDKKKGAAHRTAQTKGRVAIQEIKVVLVFSLHQLQN